jgi:hypothetical protein
MANGLESSTLVVRDDTVGVEMPRRTVDEDKCRAGAPLFVEVGVIVARRDNDDPVDASLAE